MSAIFKRLPLIPLYNSPDDEKGSTRHRIVWILTLTISLGLLGITLVMVYCIRMESPLILVLLGIFIIVVALLCTFTCITFCSRGSEEVDEEVDEETLDSSEIDF